MEQTQADQQHSSVFIERHIVYVLWSGPGAAIHNIPIMCTKFFTFGGKSHRSIFFVEIHIPLSFIQIFVKECSSNFFSFSGNYLFNVINKKSILV